jgi:hypothetical protein
MNWDDCLALGATKIAGILGCPVTTAHSWIRRSGPPEWQKTLFTAAIAAEVKKQKAGASSTPEGSKKTRRV